jgi:hypothetical protein
MVLIVCVWMKGQEEQSSQDLVQLLSLVFSKANRS